VLVCTAVHVVEALETHVMFNENSVFLENLMILCLAAFLYSRRKVA